MPRLPHQFNLGAWGRFLTLKSGAAGAGPCYHVLVILRGLSHRGILLINAGTGRNAVWISRNPLLPQQE